MGNFIEGTICVFYVFFLRENFDLELRLRVVLINSSWKLNIREKKWKNCSRKYINFLSGIKVLFRVFFLILVNEWKLINIFIIVNGMKYYLFFI